MPKTDPDSLVVLSTYVATHPPKHLFNLRREALVYLKPGYRFRIIEEETSDLAYGLDRMEQLAHLGLSDAEVDTQSFCRDLLAAISPQMSRYDMRNLELAIRHSRKADKDPSLEEDATSLARVLVESLRPVLSGPLPDQQDGFNALVPEMTRVLAARLQGKD